MVADGRENLGFLNPRGDFSLSMIKEFFKLKQKNGVSVTEANIRSELEGIDESRGTSFATDENIQEIMSVLE